MRLLNNKTLQILIVNAHGGHADEWEGSLVKAIEPGLVKAEYNVNDQPFDPLGRMRHLGSRLFSGY